MYKALVTFSGKISMTKDEVRSLKDKDVIKDLLNANFIEEVKKETEKPKKK